MQCVYGKREGHRLWSRTHRLYLSEVSPLDFARTCGIWHFMRSTPALFIGGCSPGRARIRWQARCYEQGPCEPFPRSLRWKDGGAACRGRAEAIHLLQAYSLWRPRALQLLLERVRASFCSPHVTHSNPSFDFVGNLGVRLTSSLCKPPKSSSDQTLLSTGCLVGLRAENRGDAGAVASRRRSRTSSGCEA